MLGTGSLSALMVLELCCWVWLGREDDERSKSSTEDVLEDVEDAFLTRDKGLFFSLAGFGKSAGALRDGPIHGIFTGNHRCLRRCPFSCFFIINFEVSAGKENKKRGALILSWTVRAPFFSNAPRKTG